MTTAATNTQTITFGTGSVFGLASGKTPVKLGVLQDIEIDFDATVKELTGQYQFPVAIGRGAQKITGKAKSGQLDGQLMANLYFNTSLSAGFTDLADSEPHNVPATSTYTVTVTNSANFVADLGVSYASGGQLQQVASGPTQGQYSYAAGVYTFAAADASAAVLISYTFTQTTGHSMTIANALMGTQPVFQLIMKESFSNFGTNQYVVLTLNRCTSSKLTAPFKNTDFSVSEFDFSAFTDSSNNVGTWGFSG